MNRREALRSLLGACAGLGFGATVGRSATLCDPSPIVAGMVADKLLTSEQFLRLVANPAVTSIVRCRIAWGDAGPINTVTYAHRPPNAPLLITLCIFDGNARRRGR